MELASFSIRVSGLWLTRRENRWIRASFRHFFFYRFSIFFFFFFDELVKNSSLFPLRNHLTRVICHVNTVWISSRWLLHEVSIFSSTFIIVQSLWSVMLNTRFCRLFFRSFTRGTSVSKILPSKSIGESRLRGCRLLILIFLIILMKSLQR